jgi:acylglycerol lipase
MSFARAALVLVTLLAAACAPRVEGLGPGIQAPRLSEAGFETADGYVLPVDRALPYGAPDAVLLALHGFNDYAAAFKESGPKWAAKGIAVYAYDQRGFGRTAGRGLWHGAEALTSDLAAAVDLLRARYPEVPITVLGESMGAAVVIAGLTDPTLPTPKADRYILSAPAVWGRAVMPWWQRWPLAVFSHTLPWLEVAPRIRRRPSDNIEMLRALSRDPWMIRRTRIDSIHGLVGLMDLAHAGIPDLGENTLLLYGANEDILPEAAWRGAVSRLAPGAGWRLAIYDTGYHMLTRDLNADIVIDDIAAFAKDPAAPLPSGRETDGTTLPQARE